MKDIEYHNIEIGHLWREAICFTMGYAGDGYNPKDFPTMPTVENVLVDGFTCEKSSVAVQIAGVDGFPMKSIHLKDFTAKAGVNVQTDFVENLCMENVTFK